MADARQLPIATTNLTLRQAIDIDVPIGCGDVTVFPGDVMVGDGEGRVVIPAHLAGEVADEAVEMTAFEDFVIEDVQGGRSILGLYRRPIPGRSTTSLNGARGTGVGPLLPALESPPILRPRPPG